MTLETILVSIVTIVLGGLISWWFYKKGQKCPCKMSCTKLENINFANCNSLGKHKLTMFLDNKITNGDVTYVKYLLSNTGYRDIDSQLKSTDDKIEFVLPKDAEWLDFNVVSKSVAIETKTSIDNEIAILQMSRFRVNEMLIIDGIYQNAHNEEVKIKHRLKDTENVSVAENLLSPSILELHEYVSKFMLLIFYLIFSVTIFISLIPFETYYVNKAEPQYPYWEVKIVSPDSVLVKEPGHRINAPKPYLISLDEFHTNYERYPKMDIMNRNSYILLSVAFLINLICISWSAKKPIEAIISRRKNRKTYLQLLQNANNNQQN